MKKVYYVFFLLSLLFSCSNEVTPDDDDNDNPPVWSVKFNSNGGSAISSMNIKNQTLIKKPTDPKKTGFTFDAWYVDNNTFEKRWGFENTYVVSDTTLYAKWNPLLWKITFESNGGTPVDTLKNVAYGSSISKPNDPTREYYKFDGWYTDDNLFEQEWDFSTNTVTSNVVLYAKWVLVSAEGKTYNNFIGLVADCADPYVLEYNGAYYLYGTGGNDGIKVYRSDDMVNWSSAIGATFGYALHKNNVWGEKWFWAPEVYHLNNKFYMFYSAEERIAVAESSSPTGPFRQSEDNKKPFHANIGEIDTHLFIDDDGKHYLYFVRFTNGNEIWAAELNDDLYSIKENTLVKCFGASQEWEDSKAEPHPGFKVNEGPFMLKHKGLYYLTYSANHYQNPNYGVGYATSKSPLGPWKKYENNPILTGNKNINGVGHHSFITLSEKSHYIVFHSHFSTTEVGARKLGIDRYEFVPSATEGEADVIKVYGPTTTPQALYK